MKKGLFILSLICFSGLLMAQEVQPEEQQPEQKKIKGVHPYDLVENERIVPEFAHWSIIPRIGFSAFDGDFPHEQKHSVAIPSVGLAVEYNFTPVWSVGVEYMYDMYTVTGKTGDGLNNVDTLLNGHMHKAGAYIAMDVINLFFPRVRKKIVSIFPYVGAGGAWYKRSSYYMDNYYYDAEKGRPTPGTETHQRGNTTNYVNADGKVGADYDTDYNMIGYIQGGLDLDFNLNRTIALGLRANYTYFTRDYVDGRGYHIGNDSHASKNNDGVFDITLNMRFKLEAVSKSHVRNMPSFEMFDKMVAESEPKIIPHDTVIIYRHDSIIVREIIKEAPKAPRIEKFNVYFDNDKSIIRQDGMVTISEVADRMENDNELYAVVIGYCDNTGSNGHNFGLGDRRADVVVDELIQEFGIPADHLYGKGTGKLVGRRSKKSFGLNRRATIHLVDEETFELMKVQLDDKSENRDLDFEPTFENTKPVRVPNLKEEEVRETTDGETQKTTVPLSESARKEKINEYKERKSEAVVVEKGVTLSKLARKYYNNMQCWVYIFIANRDQLKSPNDVREGMTLMIPELTEDELNVSVKDCILLYGTAARNK